VGSTLEVDGLRVAYTPDRPVLDGVDMVVPRGTLTALLGPSGCGKSTLLRAVAGLLAPDAGDVRVDGRSVLGVPPERRPIGLVFQKPLLFAHLTVAQNVAFGLRMRGVGARERRRRTAEVLDRVELGGVGPRRGGRRWGGQLSGGQEQRVALARALVLDPPVLLLDEPFSQLDAALRERMRELVRGVQRELAVTMLFVTHDQQEAVDLADDVALLLDGRLEATGDPADFYTAPRTLRAARFFGPVNEIPGTLAGTAFACPAGTVTVAPGGTDGPGVLVVRPEAVHLADGPRPGTLPAVVVGERFRGTHRTVLLDLAETVRLTATVPTTRAVARGEIVDVVLAPDACRVLPPG
jgi:ABC-type Fe3+/spermidine/putrescine transport system ATPase subunit